VILVKKESIPVLGDLLQCYRKKRGILKVRNVFINSNAHNAYTSLNPYYILSSFTTVVVRIFVSRSVLPKFSLPVSPAFDACDQIGLVSRSIFHLFLTLSTCLFEPL
jgi:hypothetical protein